MLAENKKQIKILVIDDSQVVLHALSNFLKGLNFEVRTCSDGLDGISTTQEYRPDLIMLDLMMPNFDGIKFLQVKKVVREISDIPVIVISANTNKKNVLTSIELGATKVVSKPLQKEILLSTLKEVLGPAAFSDVSAKEAEVDIGKFAENIQDNISSDFKKKMIEIFLNTFRPQREQAEKAFSDRNKEVLNTIAHQLISAGGTVGVPEISKLAREIEDKNIKTDIDWLYVQIRWEKILKYIKQFENLDAINKQG